MASAEQEFYISLIERLRALPDETEWAEFKVNNCEPETIGEYISALSNSAAYCDKEKSYLLWGINDITHEIEGTKFVPKKAKKGNQELENWLLGSLKQSHLNYVLQRIMSAFQRLQSCLTAQRTIP